MLAQASNSSRLDQHLRMINRTQKHESFVSRYLRKEDRLTSRDICTQRTSGRPKTEWPVRCWDDLSARDSFWTYPSMMQWTRRPGSIFPVQGNVGQSFLALQSALQSSSRRPSTQFGHMDKSTTSQSRRHGHRTDTRRSLLISQAKLTSSLFRVHGAIPCVPCC